MRWLDLGDYFGTQGFGILGPKLRFLTDKGRDVAISGNFPEDEKKLLYAGEDPYAVFIAQQFNKDDQDLVTYIRERVLEPRGFKATDGRVEGLEEFRNAILEKIQRSRFFVCLLTKRNSLASGNSVSSVWLYQETGIAVAFGKKPLILVEEGIENDYIGELQKVYEYIMFTRSNHSRVFNDIERRLIADLKENNIPLPASSQPSC